MKQLKDFIMESLFQVNESFQSKIVKEFIEKCKEYNPSYDTNSNSMVLTYFYKNLQDFACISKDHKLKTYKGIPFILEVLKDEDIYNQKIYNLDEIAKLLHTRKLADIIKIANNKKLGFIVFHKSKWIELKDNNGHPFGATTEYGDIVYGLFLESSAAQRIDKIIQKVAARNEIKNPTYTLDNGVLTKKYDEKEIRKAAKQKI